MIYENVMQAVFLSRPNRFLARVLLNGNEEVCHVKNTGRLGELLIPGPGQENRILADRRKKRGRPGAAVGQH